MHVAEAEIFLLAGPAAVERLLAFALAHIPAEPLDVVDEHAEPVEPGGRRGPGKSDVGDADRERRGDVREQGAKLAVAATEHGGRLQDGVEAPSRGAINEEANKDPLVEQTGPGLRAGPR